MIRTLHGSHLRENADAGLRVVVGLQPRGAVHPPRHVVDRPHDQNRKHDPKHNHDHNGAQHAPNHHPSRREHVAQVVLLGDRHHQHHVEPKPVADVRRVDEHNVRTRPSGRAVRQLRVHHLLVPAKVRHNPPHQRVVEVARHPPPQVVGSYHIEGRLVPAVADHNTTGAVDDHGAEVPAQPKRLQERADEVGRHVEPHKPSQPSSAPEREPGHQLRLCDSVDQRRHPPSSRVLLCVQRPHGAEVVQIVPHGASLGCALGEGQLVVPSGIWDGEVGIVLPYGVVVLHN